MKTKLLSFIALGCIAFAACKKDDSNQSGISEDKILLKNGIEYPRDSVITKLSLYSNIPVDSLIYNDAEKTFYILGFNLEVDPIKYLGL
ncbi:hypothetical protein [Sphingobacterium arenae]|uniref:Uncharacterized protein n=1 Tax=Sphingobacterium arenae TaxID=1280598 RepID=A0ABR7Y602_9SPHI|nr:hypothetical protein [Sphingobacterium arenae]MBD1426717.1 hypothetical protein [Sphingobacterium arenae]